MCVANTLESHSCADHATQLSLDHLAFAFVHQGCELGGFWLLSVCVGGIFCCLNVSVGGIFCCLNVSVGGIFFLLIRDCVTDSLLILMSLKGTSGCITNTLLTLKSMKGTIVCVTGTLLVLVSLKGKQCQDGPQKNRHNPGSIPGDAIPRRQVVRGRCCEEAHKEECHTAEDCSSR